MSSALSISAGSPAYVGATIYYWGIPEQRGLLRHGFRRWLTTSMGENLAANGWFCRYDSRGPHIFALFKTAKENASLLCRYLTTEVSGYLMRIPSTVSFTTAELQALHAGCRGRSMSASDRSPGLGENNSFHIFEHDSASYPLSLARHDADRNRLWQEMSALSQWVLDHLDNPLEAAVRCFASLDCALGCSSLGAPAFWEYYAASLIVSDGPEDWPSRAAKMRPQVHRLLARNRETLNRVYAKVLASPEANFDFGPFVTAARLGRPVDRQLTVIREIAHLATGQLGLIGRLEIPLVLYAWHRHFDIG